MDDYPSRKKVCKMFYMTKNHLNVSEKTMYDCYWSYFNRAWHNEEFSYVHDKGFEEVWEAKAKENGWDLEVLENNS